MNRAGVQVRRRTASVALLPVLLCVLAAGVARAQDDQLKQRILRTHPFGVTEAPWRDRLLEVDRLLSLESLGRAATVLEQAEKLGAPRAQTLPRWVQLRERAGEPDSVVALCREGLAVHPRQLRLQRALAGALMDLGRDDEARAALNTMFAASPNKVSSVGAGVAMWRAHGRPGEALALCDSLRAATGDDMVFVRQVAACRIEMGDVAAGMDETVRELRANPLNLPPVRNDLLDLLKDDHDLEQAVDALADRDAGVPAAQLLRADFLLRLGRGDAATKITVPLTGSRQGAQLVYREAGVLAREIPLQTDPDVRRAATSWLMTNLESLAGSDAMPRGQQVKVLDTLAGVCEDALTSGDLGSDPEATAARLDRVLDLVRSRNPGSSRLYTARIKLAEFTRDVLGRPRDAAAELERLLVDLDLPIEGVALARLALGETYLACVDTVRARKVLTRLGRVPRFRDAAGRAHYLLALLDFAQGHWETARDRLAAVALDDPGADVANDALDLGLLIAEELQEPTGGPSRLRDYAPTVLWQLARRPDERSEALAQFLAAAPDSEEDRLFDRARIELAGLLSDAGDHTAAAAQCSRLASAAPDSPLAPRALLELGENLTAAGRADDGRAAWQRLLLQYPDALEAEDARLKLRSVP